MRDLICYCFEYTSEDIRQDFIKHGRSMIMEKIKFEKKMGVMSLRHPKPQRQMMPAGRPPGGGQFEREGSISV